MENMKRNRLTPVVFGEIFLQPILLEWWLRNTQITLKLTQSETNKKPDYESFFNSRKGTIEEFVFHKKTFT
jgi:hypothetical protein